MGKQKGEPKYRTAPTSEKQVRASIDPDAYRKEFPVWRFKDFDWEGPWGESACRHAITNIKKHIEMHLASFETMTWEEILRASGGKGKNGGNNHHPITIDKFSKEARDRLKERGILSDTLFSLRLEQCTRIYGVREGSCLRLVFFDPHHCERDGRAAYKW